MFLILESLPPDSTRETLEFLYGPRVQLPKGIVRVRLLRSDKKLPILFCNVLGLEVARSAETVLDPTISTVHFVESPDGSQRNVIKTSTPLGPYSKVPRPL